MTIILYDIPSTVPGNPCSPNTWKVRYCLNYKGIPYRTEWIEFPDIKPHCEKLGIKPTGKAVDGSDLYTLPAIHDPSTGAYVSESLVIAEYLDKTYPSTKPILPHNTLGLQTAFVSAFEGSVMWLLMFWLPSLLPFLNPPSLEYFRRTREQLIGKKLEDIIPREEAVEKWAKAKEDMGRTDAWYAKMDGGKGNKTPFLMGDALSFADLAVAGYLISQRIVWGEESEKWQDILTWHGGRWKRLLENLKKYETIG